MHREIIRESLAKWTFLAAIAAIDAIWISISDFHLVARGLVGLLPLLLIPTAAAWVCLIWRNNISLFVFFDTFAQFCAFAAAGQVLTYLLFSTGLPLQDANMAAADLALGVDWPRYVAWIQAHPAFDLTWDIVYVSWIVEWLGILVLLAYWSEHRVRELSGSILISGAMMFIIVLLLPALSALPYFAPTHPELAIKPYLMYHDIGALRDGSLRVIDLPKTEGLVTLPSFHCIVAILLAYAMRGWRVLYPLAIVWSGLIMISTLSAGGHYFVDIIAAAIVCAIAVRIYRRASRWAAPR